MNEQEIKNAVGNMIRAYRKKLNLTQSMLGEIIDINQRQVALIETGKSFPSLSTMVKLTEVFKCQIRDFFDFEEGDEYEKLYSQIKTFVDACSTTELKQLYDYAKYFKNNDV